MGRNTYNMMNVRMHTGALPAKNDFHNIWHSSFWKSLQQRYYQQIINVFYVPF